MAIVVIEGRLLEAALFLCTLSLKYAKGVRYCGRFAKHGARTAVALFTQLNRALHSLRLNIVTGQDVLKGDLYKYPGMLLRTLTVDTYLVGGNFLAFLAQKRQDVHSGTARQAYQEHLHWARAGILAHARLGCIEYDVMTRTRFNIEAEPCF